LLLPPSLHLPGTAPHCHPANCICGEHKLSCDDRGTLQHIVIPCTNMSQSRKCVKHLPKICTASRDWMRQKKTYKLLRLVNLWANIPTCNLPDMRYKC
jgi:hypothetical protein